MLCIDSPPNHASQLGAAIHAAEFVHGRWHVRVTRRVRRACSVLFWTEQVLMEFANAHLASDALALLKGRAVSARSRTSTTVLCCYFCDYIQIVPLAQEPCRVAFVSQVKLPQLQ